MDIESTTQLNKAEFFSHWGIFLKALPSNSKSKMINFTRSIKNIGQDDPRRVIHSLKMGIALTLVSLLYYLRPLYDGFGLAGICAVLTVIAVFEFTVGATFNKGLNGGCATLLGGALGFGGQHLATIFGERGEPFVLGTLVFILAAGSTFSRFFPKIKERYDYGVVTFILTFCLVTVSGYRVEQLFELVYQRLSTVLIGTTTCMVISILVCPVWAGEDLHKLVASNIEKLANYLEGFEGEYFQCLVDKEKTEESVLQGYKSVLNSKKDEELLADLAWWELGHGGFRLRHPWKQYLKIGELARECAFKIETLNKCLDDPEIQASLKFKSKVQESCTKMSSESSNALKAISSSIKTMADPSTAKCHIDNSKTAIEDLKIALETVSLEHGELLARIPVVAVGTILKEITKTVEKIYESVSELSHLAHFKSKEPKVSPEKPPLLHPGIIKPVVMDIDNADHIEISIQDISTNSPEEENADHIEITIQDISTNSQEEENADHIEITIQEISTNSPE